MAKNVQIKVGIDTKNAVKSVDDLNNEIKGTETVVKSVKTRLRELQDEMADIGDINSPQFQKLAKEAGGLKDQMNNANAAIKAMSADFPKLEVGLGVFNALGGATQVFTGAMAALGLENEAAEETIKKLVAIQSVMNGVNSIANALSDEQVLGQKLRVFWSKVQQGLDKKSIALRIKDNLLSGISVVKNIALAAATGIATAAQWALNVALNANPIGLIVAAIGLLIGGILYLTDSIGGIIDTFKEWGLALLNLIPGFALLKGAYDYFFGEEAKAIDESIENNKKRLEELEKEEAVLQSKSRQIDAFYSKEKKHIQDSIDAATARGENTEQLTLDLIQAQKDEANAVRVNSSEQIKAISEIIKLKIKLGDITEEERDKLKEDLQVVKDSYNESTENLRVAKNEEIAIETAANDKLVADRKKANDDYRKRVEKANAEILKIKTKGIEDVAEREIASIENTFNDKVSKLSTNIKAEADLIIALEEQKGRDIQAVNDKVAAKAANEAQKVSDLNVKLLETQTSSIDSTLTQRLAVIESQYSNRESALRLSLDNDKITLEEFGIQSEILALKKANDIAKINEDAKTKEFEMAQSLSADKIALIEAEIANSSDIESLRLDGENASHEQSLSALDKSLADKKISQEQYNLQLETLELTHQQRLTAIEQEEAQKRKELSLERVNTAIDIAGQLADIAGQLSDIKIDKINSEIDAVNTAADAETAKRTEQLENGLITQREFDALELKAQTKKNATELKLRKEAFETKKKNDLVSAAINTALGITSALAAPFPLSIVMTALAAVTGAVQIAAISGQQFKAAQGGIVPGSPSGVDSVNSLLAPGEFVINSNSSQLFGPELSAINEAGGGKQLVPNNISTSTTSNMAPIKTYVVESEITDSQKGINKIEELSTF